MTLNPHQQRAARSPAPYLVIRAGAGSGKTRTLLERAVAEAERPDVPRVRLAAFTRAAAGEMASRLDAAGLPDDLRRKIDVGTLHGYAHGLLRQHGAGGEMGRDFGIVDGVDEQAIEKEAKARRENPALLRGRARLLRYADLLRYATRALRAGQMEGETGGALLLDEAQDLTREEWAFVAALAPDRLTACGDMCQAIFGWRGGLPDFQYHAHAAVGRQQTVLHTLPVNYRSLQAILDVANRLDLPGRVDLEAARGPGGRVEVWAEESDAHLAARIIAAIDEPGAGPGDWAILSRTSRRLEGIAAALEDALFTVHAPVLAGKAWDGPEARALLDCLHVVANPHDTFHLRRVLARAGWTERDMLAAEEGRAGEACSLWDWACRHADPVSEAAEVMRVLHDLRVLGAVAYACAWRLDNARGWRPSYLARHIPPDLTPAEFLTHLADPGAREALSGEAPAGAVTLATVHGAKGREWRNVVVLGCEDGSLPLVRRDSTPEDMEEERRLFYVAATRAADRLILAWSRERPAPWGGGTVEGRPSRFLSECGL